ncbi:MAG: hypothetical protein ABIH22_02955 [Candidatus Margulisiibacteriota bacterium]
MKMKEKWLAFCFFAGVALFVFILLLKADAVTFTSTGSPGDTPSGTIITAEAANCTLDYKDSGGSSMAQVNPASDIETTVLPIYGCSGPGSPANQNSSGPGDPKTYSYVLTNEGNVSTTFSLTKEVSYTGVSSGWTINIVEGGTSTVTDEITLSEDGQGLFDVTVTPTISAVDGDTATVTVYASTTLGPSGSYTGANGLTYGGLAATSDATVTTISGAPTLTLTRTSTVDAPTVHAAHTGADIHDAVPGSVITFTYAFENTGGGAATSNIIVDKIPTNTSGCHVNATSEVANVTITAAKGTATGWTVSTSEVASPSRVYGNTADWTQIGTIDASTDYATFEGGSGNFTLGFYKNSTYIKLEKASIAGGTSGTLMWGVTID